MPRLLTLRNVLLMIGAYYLSTWVFFFAWLPFTQLVEGRVYHPGWEDFWTGVFHMVPFALAALAAGITAGLFLETGRPLIWALAMGAFVALSYWSSYRWHVKPAVSDLLVQGSKAVLAGSIAFAGYWLVERRRSRIISSDADAPA